MSGTEEFTPVAETEVEHQFDELDVDDAPLVGIVMGSKSDMPAMERAGDDFVTAGGRVLNVTALGGTPAEARDRVYAAVERIDFDGMQVRSDIAARAVAGDRVAP